MEELKFTGEGIKADFEALSPDEQGAVIATLAEGGKISRKHLNGSTPDEQAEDIPLPPKEQKRYENWRNQEVTRKAGSRDIELTKLDEWFVNRKKELVEVKKKSQFEKTTPDKRLVELSVATMKNDKSRVKEMLKHINVSEDKTTFTFLESCNLQFSDKNIGKATALHKDSDALLFAKKGHAGIYGIADGNKGAKKEWYVHDDPENPTRVRGSFASLLLTKHWQFLGEAAEPIRY